LRKDFNLYGKRKEKIFILRKRAFYKYNVLVVFDSLEANLLVQVISGGLDNGVFIREGKTFKVSSIRSRDISTSDTAHGGIQMPESITYSTKKKKINTL
jgi:hypothetical protein